MKIHKTSILNILFISLLLYCFSALNSFAYATEKIVIKVAYDTNNGIFDKPDSLDLKGFGYDILTRVEHYSNYTFEYIKYNLPEAIQALEKGEIDLIGITLDDHSQNDKLMFIPKVLGIHNLFLQQKKKLFTTTIHKLLMAKRLLLFTTVLFKNTLTTIVQKEIFL